MRNETQTRNETMKTTVNCPKCGGRGYIGAFAHVADGVCFCCNGQKTIEVDFAKKIAALSEDTRRKADWIMQATPDKYEGLSYGKLLKIRDFALGGWGLTEAYPEMWATYRENGEPTFQAAQEEKLVAFYATN